MTSAEAKELWEKAAIAVLCGGQSMTSSERVNHAAECADLLVIEWDRRFRPLPGEEIEEDS